MIHKDFRCQFYFIRHGESESNANAGFAAGADFNAPLTDRGVDQARLLGRRLSGEGVRFDRVYSSSLARAVRTTEAMLEAMGQGDGPFVRVDAIIEQQIPGWRGVPIKDVYTPDMVAYMACKGLDFVPPEGESLRTVQRRVSGWLEDEIIYNRELVARERSLTVAVVAHGNALRCLFQHIMGFDERLITLVSLDNCSISRFLFDAKGWGVVCINDSSHINKRNQDVEACP